MFNNRRRPRRSPWGNPYRSSRWIRYKRIGQRSIDEGRPTSPIRWRIVVYQPGYQEYWDRWEAPKYVVLAVQRRPVETSGRWDSNL